MYSAVVNDSEEDLGINAMLVILLHFAMEQKELQTKNPSVRHREMVNR